MTNSIKIFDTLLGKCLQTTSLVKESTENTRAHRGSFVCVLLSALCALEYTISNFFGQTLYEI